MPRDALPGAARPRCAWRGWRHLPLHPSRHASPPSGRPQPAGPASPSLHRLNSVSSVEVGSGLTARTSAGDSVLPGPLRPGDYSLRSVRPPGPPGGPGANSRWFAGFNGWCRPHAFLALPHQTFTRTRAALQSPPPSGGGAGEAGGGGPHSPPMPGHPTGTTPSFPFGDPLPRKRPQCPRLRLAPG